MSITVTMMNRPYTRRAQKKTDPRFKRRLLLISTLFTCVGLLLSSRLFQLHILHKDFLRAQGNARAIHLVQTPSYRGVVADRRGEPLAVSTPVDAVWIDPRRFNAGDPNLNKLANLIDVPAQDIRAKAEQYPNRAFLYLKRDLMPDIAQRVRRLKIRGVYLNREYRRYYPTGPDTAQLLGFTDIDDAGQAGLELHYDDALKPLAGLKRVMEDRTGQWMQDLESIRMGRSGQNITLSVDARIQAMALKELTRVMEEHRAKSATVVMLDVQTGEVLCMVSAPSFNPNKREDRTGTGTRLRAITDPFEPGSTIKAVTIAAALETGKFTPESIIDTNPGSFQLGQHTIKDFRNYGNLTVREVLTKSSNVAISKIALALEPRDIVDSFLNFGLGNGALIGLPGENSGQLNYDPNQRYSHASFGFGYGFAVTPLQLAHAYAILGAGGIDRPVSILKLDAKNTPRGRRVLSQEVTETILDMLATVTQSGGTGRRAHIPGYRTAGKTGTIRVVGPNGYDPDRHVALFAGITPVTNPRLATVIVVEEPQDAYYGGLIAAPLYAKIVGGALHMLNYPPDNT